METPHEAVSEAIHSKTWEPYETQATAAIEALRKGAHGRIAKAEDDSLVRSGYAQDWRGLDTSQIINAILGPSNEVPE